MQSEPKPFATGALYVGDLDVNVGEQQIFDIFNRIAPVVSTRICRDAASKRSLGYCYVNYNTRDEALRAMEALNFTNVNGKSIRVMLSSRDPSIRRSGTGNVFVKHLDKTVDSKQLYDLFSPFGTILSCKLAADDSNVSKGYGFVQFDSEEAAFAAIESLNDTILKDKKIMVQPFVRRQEREGSSGSSTNKFCNVFVKNLPETTTAEDLKDLFIKYGPISSAVVMTDAAGKSKMFGFVNFENPDDAANAVEGLHNYTYEDKVLYVGRAQKKTEREAELKAQYEAGQQQRGEANNLYVKNLDDSIDEDKLQSLFRPYGVVTSHKVMKDPQGHSKGAGFVSMETSEAAKRAMVELSGRMVGSKPLYVAEAERKDVRKAKLEAQYSTRPPAQMFSTPPPMSFYQPQLGMYHAHQMPAPFFGGGRPMSPQYHRQSPWPGAVGAPHTMQQQMPHFQRTNNYQMHPRGPPQHNFRSERSLNLASALAHVTPDDQRVMLGEQLYPLVDDLDHSHASKITGMLLEMDQTEILHLLETPEALRAKVEEAAEVIDHSQFLNSGVASLSLAA